MTVPNVPSRVGESPALPCALLCIGTAPILKPGLRRTSFSVPSKPGGNDNGHLKLSRAQSSRNELRELMSAPVVDWDAIRAAQKEHYKQLSNSSLKDEKGGVSTQQSEGPSANASWDVIQAPTKAPTRKAVSIPASVSFANILGLKAPTTTTTTAKESSTANSRLTLKRRGIPNKGGTAKSAMHTLKRSRSDHWVTYKGYKDLIRRKSLENMMSAKTESYSASRKLHP